MSENKILATVDGVNITQAELDAFIASLPREQQMYAANPQFREQCLDEVLNIHLFAKMGKEEKLDETEQFRSFMESAKKDILAQLAMRQVINAVEVSTEECREYYEANTEKFRREETVNAKHILVKEEAEILAIKQLIESGEKEFEAMAREHSVCGSAAKGGSLGTFGKGQMVKEFEEAAFNAEIGTIVGPVQTQFGYHLIKVEDKTEPTIAGFEMVESQIKKNLMQKKQNEAYAAKSAELREKYLNK
ncbi:MAG: peptidylprolyl isomerase [Oscillospiraceae bacterium]|nr:peptidylprolyl isomerase [Oscillospiraceae bacterium]